MRRVKRLLSRINQIIKQIISNWLASELQVRPYIHGDEKRVSIGQGVSLVNTLINTASGTVTIGNDVIFGHNCMLLTGRHDFENGKRRRLSLNQPDTPHEGHDITIGEGTWVASGVIIVGGVRIGSHSIIGAGAVVTKDVEDGSFVAGVPAKSIMTTKI